MTAADLASTLGVPLAFGLGLAFGAGPCLISCFPYLGPVFLACGGGLANARRILLPMAVGRLSAYTAFAAAVGAIGERTGLAFGYNAAGVVIGGANLGVGLAVLLRLWPNRAGCAVRHAMSDGLFPGGMFLLGIAMTLTPCAPLALVLGAAAAAAGPLDGGLLGLAFGLGAVTVPTLTFGVGSVWLGGRLKDAIGSWSRLLECVSAALLMASGVAGLLWGAPD